MCKSFSILLACVSLFLAPQVYAATTASQTVSATLTRTPPGPGPGPVIPGGAIVGIAGGGVAAGASAFAFAPLLLAGLTPNSVVFAAAPIGCIPCVQNFLQSAITSHFCVKDYAEASAKMSCNPSNYLVQNNSEIINGTYDMHALTIPKELQGAKRLRVNVTVASQPYKLAFQEPELAFGIYKNISPTSLSKKFETQQFLHHYLMNKYEIPLKMTSLQPGNGLQKLTGVIELQQLQNPSQPLQVVLRYTDGGFKKGQKAQNPKTLVYAYVAEFFPVR